MGELLSTSYRGADFFSVFRSLTNFYEAESAIEIGVQQGGSAIAIGQGMKKGTLYLYDKFADAYDYFPHGPTHADMVKLEENMTNANLLCDIKIEKSDAYDVYKLHDSIDIIHLDIGNTYPILQKLLPPWLEKTKYIIFLEGGISNKWQRDYGYENYRPLLEEPLIKDNWDHVTIHRNNHNSLTILTRNN